MPTQTLSNENMERYTWGKGAAVECDYLFPSTPEVNA
jgi:hypothetical protein